MSHARPDPIRATTTLRAADSILATPPDRAARRSPQRGRPRRRRALAALAAGLLATGLLATGLAAGLGAPAALAQGAPAGGPGKPFRLIVGYAAGGPADTMARIVAPLLGRELGQSVVVENRPGASGALGVAGVTQSDPDGYTLLYAAVSEITVAPAVAKVAYDPQKDLAPVALVARSPFILLASSQFPPNTIAELVAYAKANPGRTSYASFGTHSITHLAGERFKQLTGIDSAHVPYKGGGQAAADLISGQVQFSFDTPTATLNLVRGGKLKPIAVASAERISVLPDTPTTREAGLPAMQVSSWQGLFAPAKTPKPVIDRLNAALNAVLKMPEMVEAMASRSLVAGGGSPADLAGQVARELDEWRAVAPLAGAESKS